MKIRIDDTWLYIINADNGEEIFKGSFPRGSIEFQRLVDVILTPLPTEFIFLYQ